MKTAEVTVTLANRGGASFRVFLPTDPPEGRSVAADPIVGDA